MTADILIEKGQNNGKRFVRIDDLTYDVPNYLTGRLEEIPNGEQVGFREYNNVLTGIWRKSKPNPKPVFNSAPPKGSGNGKNELLIVAQHNFGIVAEVFMECTSFQDIEPKDALREIYRLNKLVSERMMKDCGGAS